MLVILLGVGYLGIICLLLVPKSSRGSRLACRRKLVIICGQREDYGGLKYDYLQKMETKPLPLSVGCLVTGF